MNEASQQVTALNAQALALYERGAYQEARALARVALEAADQLTEDRSYRIPSLNTLALTLTALGELSEAGECYRQILEMLEQTPGTNESARAVLLGNVAAFYQETGRYAEARHLYEQAADLLSRTLGEHSEDFGNVSANLGDLCVSIGDYAEAEEHLSRALAIYRRLQTVDSRADVVRVLNTMGVLDKTRGDYVAADSLFREALVLQRNAPQVTATLQAALLNNVASLYKNTGRVRQAEALYREALSLWTATVGAAHPNVASALHNLAELHAANDDLSAALDSYSQALAIRRAALGERHPDVADTLNGLASVWYRIGDYAQAAQQYDQALEIRRATLPADDRSIAQSLNNLGAAYLAMGDLERAEPLLREALAMNSRSLGDDHPLVASHLMNVASVCVARGRAAEAVELLERAAVIDGAILDQILSLNSDAQRLSYLSDIRWRLDWFLSLVVDHVGTDEVAGKALDLVLRRKALGAEALTAQREAVLGGRYPHLREPLTELTAVRAEIAAITLSAAATGAFPGGPKRLQDLRVREEELDTGLARDIAEMRVGLRLRKANRGMVAAALPADSVLIEFVRSERFVFGAVPSRGEQKWQGARYLAFLLPSGAPASGRAFDLGEADTIDRWIDTCVGALGGARKRSEPSQTEVDPMISGDGRERVRRVVSKAARDLGSEPGRPDPGRWSSAASQLRRLVFDPLEAALNGRTRLFVAPDGDLARIPFPALPTDDGGHLLDTYSVTYLSVGRDILRVVGDETPTGGPPVVAADPQFDLYSPATEGKPFRRLAGTRVEGELVGRHLGQKPLMGNSVLEGVLRAARGPRIFHIATHGFFVPTAEGRLEHEDVLHAEDGLAGPLAWLSRARDPLLRSGLALAGANTWLAGRELPPEADDGLLMARDVSAMDLIGTDLVVLSACETGLGQVQVGEGVFGLRRAFAVAGARTVVMSLWKVPDPETADLMDAFYRQLSEGCTPGQALRAAQAELKRAGQDVHAWGAFICQGAA